MKYFIYIFCVFAISCADLPSKNIAIDKKNIVSENDVIYDIPYINELIIDGKQDEWKTQGRKFNIHANQYGETYSSEDLSASVTLGWNKKGIALLIDVNDNSSYQRGSQKLLWRDDGVQIYLNDTYRGQNIIQYSIAPASTGTYKKTRYHISDHRRSKALQAIEPTIDISSMPKKGGYYIEALLPFSNFNMQAANNIIAGLQIYIHDRDANNRNNRNALEWYYQTSSHLNHHGFQPIRLTQNIDTTKTVSTKCYIQDLDTAYIICYADKELVGQQISIINEDTTLLQTKMQLSNTMAYASFKMSATDKNKNHQTLNVLLNNSHCATVDLGFATLRYKNLRPTPYESTIRRFEAMKRYQPLPDSSILFVGSSSFTKWYTLNEDMSNTQLVNYGFGGSQMHHIKNFIDRLIVNNKPAAVLIYEGDNDIAMGLTVNNFIDTCVAVFDRLKMKLPDTKVYFVSIKPSPSRKKYWEKMKTANDSISKLIALYPNMEYIDTATPMTDSLGNIRDDIWKYDRLHMNQKGYDLWADVINKKLREDELIR